MTLKKKEPITEAFDALKRVDELERENKKLKIRVKCLRFDLLPEPERRWVRNCFDMKNPENTQLLFGNDWEKFRCEYMDYKDTLPINDIVPF